MNTELGKVLVLDPIVDVEESYKTVEAVVKSGVNKSIYIYTADSFSNSNFIYNNITPPSLSTVVKRDLRIKYSIGVVVVWTTATGGPNLNSVSSLGVPNGFNGLANTSPSYGVVPRAAPLQSCASAIELRLNGSATSTSINDYACIYPHILDKETKSRWSSEMPLEKDDAPVYADPAEYIPGNVDAALVPGYTDNRSPFVPYGANTSEPSRGSYTWTKVSGDTAAGLFTFALYTVELVEQLFISPMLWGDMMDKSAGLCNINNLILNIRFQDVNRLVSAYLPTGCAIFPGLGSTIQFNIDGGGASIVTGISAPQLLIEYITQDPILAARLPQTLAFDYSLVQPFISSIGVVNNTTLSTSAANFTAQSLRLASIPSKLYIYAKPSKSYLSGVVEAQTTPDNFLTINNLKINFNNRINLFATYTARDLYAMSVRNGLQDSWVDWQYNTGSIVIIDVARDIGLESDECEGQSNKYSTLQVSATMSNAPMQYWGQTAAVNYDFYILVEQPGKAFISSSECQFVLAAASAAEVLALTSNLDSKVSHASLEGQAVGGGVFDKIGSLFKSGVNALKNVSPDDISKGVGMAQSALKSLGMGVAGGAMRGKHSRTY